MSKFRCAIYTRKSSEEGLELSFNSLDAQRESCSAYILSQAGEGWGASKTLYDDGGYSGGSMDRPGLRQLLADVQSGKIDVIVVYKVDRLTRSLADFARIVEILDKAGASFVSVTQAFNTTTSMGRLTLNVLLSFAQFEREVIRNAIVQISERFLIAEPARFRRQSLEQRKDGITFLGEALQMMAIGCSDRSIALLLTLVAGAFKQQRFQFALGLGGRKPSQRQKITALKPRAGRFKNGASFFVDQPRQGIRPQAVWIIRRGRTARLNMQAPS